MLHHATYMYRGTSLMGNSTPHRTTTGPYACAHCRVRGGGVFVSEVPLYAGPSPGLRKSEQNLRFRWWSHFGNFSHIQEILITYPSADERPVPSSAAPNRRCRCQHGQRHRCSALWAIVAI